MNAAKIVTALLALTLMIAQAWGQSETCLNRTVPVSVISWDGSPLPGLGPERFDPSIKLNSIRVSSFSLDQEPRRVLLLMDTSGSFLDKSDLAIGLALDLVDHIPPPSEIGLAKFAGALTPVGPPSIDRSEIRDRIKSVFPPAKVKMQSKPYGTALWDAVRESTDLLGPHRVGDVIFAITDGEDTTSKEDSDHAIHALLTKGIRLVAIEIPAPLQIRARFSNPREGDPVDRMTSVTDETGGFVIFPSPDIDDSTFKGKMPTELRRSLDLEYHLILNFYRMNVTLSQAPGKQQKWKLSLNGIENSALKNFELRYPKSFLPCN